MKQSTYAAEAPLQSLLKTHRLLALCRAPLPARIQVLRNIHLADIMNPVWMDDLRVLETARQQQAQKELDTAIQARDLTRANSLVAELDDPSWVYRPSPQFVVQAKDRRQRLAAALAAEEMQAIEQQLSVAYSALDVDAARTAGAKLRDRQQVAGLPVEHPLIQRAAPALAWLAEQDEHDSRAHGFSAALSRLEEALEADSDRPTLERPFHATQRYDQEIPLRLVRRYEQRALLPPQPNGR